MCNNEEILDFYAFAMALSALYRRHFLALPDDFLRRVIPPHAFFLPYAPTVKDLYGITDIYTWEFCIWI